MTSTNSHAHGCTFCGCNNPVLRYLKDDLFSVDHLSKVTSHLMPGEKSDEAEPLLISGGTIRPLINGSCDPVEAIGMAEGKVVAVGKLADVTRFMDENYPDAYAKRVLEDTQTLLPGLIEPHAHIVPTALMADWVNFSPFEGQNLRPGYTMDWVQTTITQNLPVIPGWVFLGIGLDPALLPPVDNQIQVINNTVLDGLYSEKPVMILSASGHTMYLNTAALNYTFEHSDAIQAKYKNLQDYISTTSGRLQEEVEMAPAVATVKAQILVKSLEAFKEITALFQQANSRGITFLYDAMMNLDYIAILAPYMLTHNNGTMRVGAAQYCTSQADVTNLTKYTPPNHYSDIYIGHVKIVSDGSNQGLTGYQSTPYIRTSDIDTPNFGMFDIPPTTTYMENVPTEYQQMLNEAVAEKGWPLMIHANGDQAVNFTIQAYQEAIKKYEDEHQGEHLRHRIEHCSLLTTAQIEDMATSGISPSFLIGHVGYWGYAFQERIFGKAKTQSLDLCQSALAHKLRISLHSDHSVTPLGPLRIMEQSITRVMEEDPNLNVLNAPECLTPEQALIAVTYDAAWQCYADQWVGSLKTGYFADFVILATDPLTMPASKISMNMRNIEVVETWVNGVKVYQGKLTPVI